MSSYLPRPVPFDRNEKTELSATLTLTTTFLSLYPVRVGSRLSENKLCPLFTDIGSAQEVEAIRHRFPNKIPVSIIQYLSRYYRNRTSFFRSCVYDS